MRTYFYLPEHHEDGEYEVELTFDGILRSGDSVYLGKMYTVKTSFLTIASDSNGKPYGGESYYQSVYLKECDK